MTMYLAETSPQGAKPRQGTRHYLISVEAGSKADTELAGACNRALTLPGLLDFHTVSAPTLILALVKFCKVFGLVQSVYLHLYAELAHRDEQKSA